MEATVEGVTECFQHDRRTDFHSTAYMGIWARRTGFKPPFSGGDDDEDKVC